MMQLKQKYFIDSHKGLTPIFIVLLINYFNAWTNIEAILYLAQMNPGGKKSSNSIIDNFNSINSLVLGDLIIDQYILCDALGMSQEDPTIVVTPNEKKDFNFDNPYGLIGFLIELTLILPFIFPYISQDEALTNLQL